MQNKREKVEGGGWFRLQCGGGDGSLGGAPAEHGSKSIHRFLFQVSMEQMVVSNAVRGGQRVLK